MENKWERVSLSSGEAERLYSKARSFAGDVWFRFRHKPTALLGLILALVMILFAVIVRLVLLPIYARIYLNATEEYEYMIAGSIMAVSCLTDLVDGKIARKFNQITNLGKVLDPFADKITQFTLTLCLSLKYPVLHPVLALFVVKEAFQLIVGIIFLTKGRMLPGALMAGKICTTILFVSLIALVLMPHMNPLLVDAIALVDGIFLLISFFLMYAGNIIGGNVYDYLFPLLMSALIYLVLVMYFTHLVGKLERRLRTSER